MNSNRILTFALLIGMTGVAACGSEAPVAQKPPAPAPKPALQQVKLQPSTPPAPVEKFMAGQVQEVNSEAKTLVLKDTKGQEQIFKFSDTTSITGAADAKSLAAQEGRPATVRFVEQGGGKSAVQIHIEAGS